MKKFLFFTFFLFMVMNGYSQQDFKNFRDREKSREYTIQDMDYHITYEAIRDTKSVKMKYYDYEDGINIKKGEEFTVCYETDAFESILYYDKYGLIVTNQSTDEELIVPFKDLGLPEKTRLPDVISSNKWCLNYHYDVLNSNNRETLSKYEWWINCFNEKLRSYFDRDSEGNKRDSEWYEVYETTPEIIITDSCISLYGFFYHYQAQGFVIDIDKNKIKVLWALSLYERCFIDEFDSIKTSYESIIEYELDGDYLNLIIDGKKLSLVKKCSSFNSEWHDLMQKNSCNLSTIAWPRHADGTCDYDDEIKPPKVQLSDNDSVSEEEEETAIPSDPLSEDEEDVKTVEETVPSVKKISSLPLVIIVASAAILLMCIVIILIVRKKKKQ